MFDRILKLPYGDKILHFVGGMVIGFGGETVVNGGGVEAATLVGAWKELWFDARRPDKHTVDFWDFVATTCGGVVGVIFKRGLLG